MKRALAPLALLLVAGPARASDFVGVYARVTKVVFEPDEANATRVQLHGAFAIADPRDGNAYFNPVVGYVHYACPPGKEAVCRMEWQDVKKFSAQGHCVGYGARFLQNGTVRPSNQAPGNPEPYPIQMGVVNASTNGAGWSGKYCALAAQALGAGPPDLALAPVDLAAPPPADLAQPAAPADAAAPPDLGAAGAADLAAPGKGGPNDAPKGGCSIAPGATPRGALAGRALALAFALATVLLRRRRGPR